jgi:hypothetical protein
MRGRSLVELVEFGGFVVQAGRPLLVDRQTVTMTEIHKMTLLPRRDLSRSAFAFQRLAHKSQFLALEEIPVPFTSTE